MDCDTHSSSFCCGGSVNATDHFALNALGCLLSWGYDKGSMSRTSNAELPSESELWEILAKESPRMAVPYDYLQRHPDVFAAFKELCREYGADFEWVDGYKHMSLGEIDARLRACFDTLQEAIVYQADPLFERVYDSLNVGAAPEKADAIFVFGSPHDVRIEKAVELYNDGFSDKIIISGHGPFYGAHTESEAERMARIAVARGIPSSALLLEPRAITIPDNIKRTLDLFEDCGLQIKKLLIVASPFVLRRCEMDWYKFTSRDIAIIPIAADSMSYDFTKEGWTTTHRGIRVILNEYAKLIFESKIDLLRRENLYSRK